MDKLNGSKRAIVHKNECISLVIATCNRESSLKYLLCSILRQTKLPKEIIVVDDGDDFRAKHSVDDFRKFFFDKGIVLKYLRNPGKKSLAKVRNLGAMHARGDVVVFLDDDVLLGKRYIEGILKVYKTYPTAVGVQGIVTNAPVSSNLYNTLKRLFFLSFEEKEKCRVLPSICATRPHPDLGKIIKVEWLSGANQSYKRAILKIHKFDENLKRLSQGEDLDFSYRIFKNYPDSLYLTPFAKVFHNYSLPSSLPDDQWIYQKTANRFYLFYKLVDQNFSNNLIFIWSVIGELIVDVGLRLHTICLNREKSKSFKMKYLREIKYLIKSYAYSIRHLQKIKMRRMEFFGEVLFASE